MGTFLVSQQMGTRLILGVVAALVFAASAAAAETPRLKVALTFDDLPLNGALPLGSKHSDFARDTVAVLKKHKIPPSYGFINARQLERNPDGALALRLWIAAGHPLANHTYSHIDLTRTSSEDFQLDVLRNEPVLQLLQPRGQEGATWKWFRYPYLHEGDTLEKRRAVRTFLAANGYRIAQTSLDYEDYLWNAAHARCVVWKDEAAIAWLRESYLTAAREFTRLQRDNARAAFGRDIHHVLLLHLGSFSAHILPDLFKLLDAEGFDIVTLEEAQLDPVYAADPDFAHPRGGTHTELTMLAKQMDSVRPYPTMPRQRLTEICQ